MIVNKEDTNETLYVSLRNPVCLVCHKPLLGKARGQAASFVQSTLHAKGVMLLIHNKMWFLAHKECAAKSGDDRWKSIPSWNEKRMFY